MCKKYMPEKSMGFGILLFACLLVCWLIFLLHSHIVILFFALIITLFFIWIWFGTSYQVNDEYFMYQSGPFRKKIPINRIVRINRNVRSLYGMRPALTFEYLQIRYNKYDDVFIAPKDEESFIADLTSLNPKITVD